MDPVLALVIIVALVCITVVAVVLTNKERGTSFFGAKLGKNTVPESQAIQVRPPAPVLQNITFKQALESDALAIGLEELAKRQVEYALGFQSATAVVRAVSLAEQREELVIAYELLRNGTSSSETGLPGTGEAVIPLHRESGKFLPTLKDADRGRLTEYAKAAPLRPANSAALLTGLAHVIPGMEVLRSLKEVDRRLSVLAEGRKVDQLAEMETIYNRLCEIFSRENWMDRRSDLIASRDQLFKLRAIWRRELDQILDSAPETPDTQGAESLAKLGSFVFLPSFWIGKGMEMHRESEEAKLFGHLAATADLMQRIRLAMLLDISVSQALGEAEILAGVAMRNELEMWEGIAEKFKSKREGIRTFITPADLQTVEDALRGYVNMLSSVTAMKATTTKRPEPNGSEPGTKHPEDDESSTSNSIPPTGYLRPENYGAISSSKRLGGNPDDCAVRIEPN
jgi:hypothetical protein